ncbi:MAG TPA: class I SAM-dependent methyltransferase [Nitrospirota bacterium]|nr:class I SAM-dependent methyltransferase [Nitrospirota bacterium]
MDESDIKKHSGELVIMLTQATAALATIQGIEVGFFDWIPANKSITAQELSGQMGYDISRVERWLRFGVANGYVASADGGYTLTTKGMLLRRGTPVPDLLGLHHMVSFFIKSISHSRDAYQKGVGLDSITQGNISRDYVPRVASQLSKTSAEFFKWSGLASGHTILDLGCGDGSVLRETVRVCPGISATGIDMNRHTLEIAKRKNIEAGLQDQVEFQPGDVTDLSRFRDGSFDWVYAINVFHFLPHHKRDPFLRDMVRISRYGVFFNQVLLNNVATSAVDVLLSTLFTDFTGFFIESDANETIEKLGMKHYGFLPIIQGESRMVVMFTSRNDIPLTRVPGILENERKKLAAIGILSAKDLLVAERDALVKLDLDTDHLRQASVKILFP